MNRFRAAAILFLFLAASGCSLFGTEPEKTAVELYEEGMAYYEDGRYKKAIKSFDDLKDWYPFSKYAVTAEIKIADAYFETEEYEEAIAYYQEFEELHPNNENTPHALFQIGNAYYVQVDTIDRDQTPAEKAYQAFERFIKTFPSHPKVPLARVNQRSCVKSMAGHDLYVGLFYYKAEHYEAALERFKAVIEDYPDVGVNQTALEYIPLCEQAIEEQKALKAESSEEES